MADAPAAPGLQVAVGFSPQRHLPEDVWVLGEVDCLHSELAEALAAVDGRLGRARDTRTALVRTRAILVVWCQLVSHLIT